MAKVLLYNINKEYDLDKFKKIADERNIEILYAYKEDIDQLVGYLAGEEGYERREESFEFNEDLDFPFILFIGFDRDDLFSFLDLMRTNGLSIQHKANETHNNINWSLRELLIENDREGRMMGLIHRINGLMAHGHKLQEKYGEDENLKELVEQIQGYFSDSTMFELEVAETYHERLYDEIKRIEQKGV